MKTRAYIRISVCLIAFLCTMSIQQGKLQAQGFFTYAPPSPFTSATLPAKDTSFFFNFLVGGHIYGAHGNENSVYPAASLLANISRINANPINMMILCGDIMRNGTDTMQIEGIKRSLRPLRFPVFNAPGNHDLTDRKVYQQHFKETQAFFIYRHNIFLLLDTEYLVSGEVDKIIAFINLQKQRQKFAPASIQNMFVFSHRAPWALTVPGLEDADAMSNEPLEGTVSKEDAQKVTDAVFNFRQNVPIYWFTGDVGAAWSVPMLYLKTDEDRHRYIATGLGDGRDDALIQVTVSRDGLVTMKPFPLTARKWQAIEQHDLAWGKEYQKAHPQKGKSIFSKKMLWLGLGMGIGLGFMLAQVWRRRKTKQVNADA